MSIYKIYYKGGSTQKDNPSEGEEKKDNPSEGEVKKDKMYTLHTKITHITLKKGSHLYHMSTTVDIEEFDLNINKMYFGTTPFSVGLMAPANYDTPEDGTIKVNRPIYIFRVTKDLRLSTYNNMNEYMGTKLAKNLRWDNAYNTQELIIETPNQYLENILNSEGKPLSFTLTEFKSYTDVLNEQTNVLEVKIPKPNDEFNVFYKSDNNIHELRDYIKQNNGTIKKVTVPRKEMIQISDSTLPVNVKHNPATEEYDANLPDFFEGVF